MFCNFKIHTEHKESLTFFHMFRTRCWMKHDTGIDCKQQATNRLTQQWEGMLNFSLRIRHLIRSRIGFDGFRSCK